MIEAAIKRISTELELVLTDEHYQWLAACLIGIESSANVADDLLNLSAGVRRKLGQELLSSQAEPLHLAPGLFLPISHWSHADAARSVLVLRAVVAFPEQAQAIIRNYFQQGDEFEVVAITRLLILFDAGESLKFYAREVGRTNSKPLFAALAQHNPYPASYYTDHEFNQLVLKALFMGVGIDALIGLAERANRELSQMCEDYIDERVAAGREIPPDIWLALEPCASERGMAKLIAHLADISVEHRYFAVKALRQHAGIDDRSQLFEARLAVETDSGIRMLLTSKQS